MRSNETKQPMLGALFAMDGTLCRLPHRGKYNEFVSRKSQPQINVLVVCEWNKNLVCVEPGFTGRTQDNDMFNNSVLHEEMKPPDFLLREGRYILVDEGFASKGGVIHPYSIKEMNQTSSSSIRSSSRRDRWWRTLSQGGRRNTPC